MLDLLFEDNHLLVVNKPSGLLTQPSGTFQDSLENQCKTFLKEKYQKKGNVFLDVIHRLDKPVSGIIVFAKTSKAVARLKEASRLKQFKKYYYALVEGFLSEREGTLEHFLVHDDFQARVVPASDPQAKQARLYFRVLQHDLRKTLLEINLDTGRYHQIRAQLAHIGHPILGDKKYGSHFPMPFETIALHHYALEIHHPITRLSMQFTAPSPHWFEEMVRE